jgi:anti-sigma regulatory factor (Ser/Thr protein kinase)
MKTNFQIKNDLSELVRLAEFIETFGKEQHLDGEMIEDIRLALDELVTNIVQYGYGDNGEHLIDFQMHLDQESLFIRVEDDGRPFDPFKTQVVDSEMPFEERELGGWGVHLVKQLMNDVSYRYADGLNRVTLKKKRR